MKEQLHIVLITVGLFIGGLLMGISKRPGHFRRRRRRSWENV